MCESDVDVETLPNPAIQHPYGTSSLSRKYLRFEEQRTQEISSIQRPCCTDLIHSCVREMIQASNADPCIGSRSSSDISLERLQSLITQMAATFDAVMACTCTKGSSSAFSVAYLLSTTFRMFRSAAESEVIARLYGRSSRLQLLRAELEKISKLADEFNARHSQADDLGPCQLLKYYLCTDLKCCLDGLDGRV